MKAMTDQFNNEAQRQVCNPTCYQVWDRVWDTTRFISQVRRQLVDQTQ